MQCITGNCHKKYRACNTICFFGKFQIPGVYEIDEAPSYEKYTKLHFHMHMLLFGLMCDERLHWQLFLSKTHSVRINQQVLREHWPQIDNSACLPNRKTCIIKYKSSNEYRNSKEMHSKIYSLLFVGLSSDDVFGVMSQSFLESLFYCFCDPIGSSEVCTWCLTLSRRPDYWKGIRQW